MEKHALHNLTRDWTAFLFVSACVLTLLFTLLNPEASSTLSLVGRFAFWTLHVTLPLAILQTVQFTVSRFWVFRQARPWVQIGLAGALGALVFTPFAFGLDILFGLADEEDDTGLPLAQQFFEEFQALGPPIVVVWLALNASRMLRLPSFAPAADATETEETTAEERDFWKRVPAELGRDLVSLSAELHYLRVVTVLGEALVLYPFGRAVELVDPSQGLRIHRSHWVSLAHVVRVESRGKGAICEMSDGRQLPVSRTYRAALKQAMS